LLDKAIFGVKNADLNKFLQMGRKTTRTRFKVGGGNQTWVLTRGTGASFTKLTYVSDVIFGNFLLANAHNIVI
jgi:hypothetical protein